MIRNIGSIFSLVHTYVSSCLLTLLFMPL